MPAGKPGLVMRRQLRELLAIHGEREARRSDAPRGQAVILLREATCE